MRLFQNTVARAIAGVAFAPDGRTLFAAGSGGFNVWHLDGRHGGFVKIQPSPYLWVFEIDPRGRWLYLSDSLGLRFRDLLSGTWRRLPGLEFSHHVISLAADATGSRFAVSRGGSSQNRLECWDVTADGNFSLAWWASARREHTMYRGLAFTADGTRLASALGVTGEPFAIFDAATGEQRASVGAADYLLHLDTAFTPDSRHFLAWNERQIDLWEVATGTQIRRPAPGRANFHGAAVHPSGQFVATAGGDGCVRMWDIPTCRPRGVLKWDIGKLHSIAFSIDGMLGAAGGDKGQVVVWDVDH